VAATPDASSRCQFDPEAMPGFDPHATRSALVSWPYNMEFDPDIMPGFDPHATGVALPSSPARTVFDPHATGADSGLATAPPPGGATSAWRGAT